MIHVAIVCAKSSLATGPCGQHDARLAPGQVEQWVDVTLREHGWYTDPASGDHYCPAHNPTDAGTVTSVNHVYRPLGESGWEARLPVGVQGAVDIEIRQRRGDDDG